MFTQLSVVLLPFRFLPSSLSNMHIDTTVDAAIQTADLVVEAVVENMELKQKLFAEYDDKVIKISFDVGVPPPACLPL